MDDLSPSAVTPTSAWEKKSFNEERHGRRRRPPDKPSEEAPEEAEETEQHTLDELA